MSSSKADKYDTYSQKLTNLIKLRIPQIIDVVANNRCFTWLLLCLKPRHTFSMSLSLMSDFFCFWQTGSLQHPPRRYLDEPNEL